MNTQLNFDIIEVINPQIFYFVDSSIYDQESTLNTYIEVLFPDKKKPYKVNIDSGILNTLTTKHFEKDCVSDFPDGIYKITMFSEDLDCSVTKYIFRNIKLLKRIDEELKDLDLTNKDVLNSYNKIAIYLHGTRIYVEENANLAKSMYKSAEEELNKLVCNGMYTVSK